MLSLRNHSSAFRAFVADLQQRNPLTLVGAGILVSIQLLVVLFLSKNGSVLYLAGFAVMLGCIQVFVRYPRIWIYTVVIGSLVYLTFESPEVNAVEVLFGLFYLGGILTWFAWQAFVRKKRIVRHAGDWLILFFIILSSTNILIAALNSIDPVEWLREWHVLLLLLYYFPVRQYFKTEINIKKLVICTVLLIIGLSSYLTYTYYSIISQGVVYAYQYRAGGTQITETIFLAGTLFGIFAGIFGTSSKTRLNAIIFTAMSVVSLILTFRRTYWLVAIICVVLALPFLKRFHLRRLITYTLVASIFVFISAYAIIGARGSQLFFNIVGQRFESSGKGTKDISLYARIIESEEAIQHIRELPLSGSGMRSPIAFYEPILRHTKHNSYIHNGYIGSLHKLGVPVTILFLLPFLYFLREGFINIRNSRDMPSLIKVLAFGSFFSLIGILICNVTLSQFNQRTGLLAGTFFIAFIEIVANYRRGSKIQ